MASLSDDEKDWFKQTVEIAISNANQPIRDMLNAHHQTLFGVNNNNGLNGDVKLLKEREVDMRLFKREVRVWGFVASTGIATAVTFLKSFIFGGK